jgi:hypothetical protein
MCKGVLKMCVDIPSVNFSPNSSLYIKVTGWENIFLILTWKLKLISQFYIYVTKNGTNKSTERMELTKKSVYQKEAQSSKKREVVKHAGSTALPHVSIVI